MGQPLHPRNKPCPCGSGKLYRFCHQRILEAPLDERLATAQREYAADWAGNADHYQQLGLYNQLTDELLGSVNASRILDVGCGQGNGLAALASRISGPGRLLLGIDENPDCLKAAAGRLGLEATLRSPRRMRHELRDDGTYDQAYETGPLKCPSDICLVQTDILFPDAEFESLLDDLPPFDAVTLWFTGTHKARQHARFVQDLGIASDARHRETVQSAAVDLALRRLRPGGRLHIATRGGYVDLDGAREQFAADMDADLEGTGLRTASVSAHPYTEPYRGRSIGIGSKAFDLTGSQMVVVSATIKRPEDT